ncbi:MAG: helix-turn-helix domain-containing protein [Nitrospira sp. CR2.1]|nr:helix-turn-helix domain-containing protein [Nitrospira sp. CR2.1]
MRPLAVPNGQEADHTRRRQEAMIPTNKARKRLYTIEEAGEYLGRSTWSVRRLIWGGTLPSVRYGRRIHVDLNDLDAFIDRHKMIE